MPGLVGPREVFIQETFRLGSDLSEGQQVRVGELLFK